MSYQNQSSVHVTLQCQWNLQNDVVMGISGNRCNRYFFVGRKTIWGWHILLLNETLWITYAIITKQYGFIFSALAYAAVYIKSFMLWRKDGS
jgi:hypothetical protein